MNRENLNVLVIAGGRSQEREISLRSGEAVWQSLQKTGYRAIFFDLKELQDMLRICQDEKINCAFLCSHGELGEDGRLQGVLDWLNIPYTGSGVAASALSLNKHLCRQILQGNNISIAKGCLLDEYTEKGEISLPAMLKSISSGSSIDLHKISSAEELNSFRGKKQKYLLEEFVKGKEITAGLLEIKGKLTLLPLLGLKSKDPQKDYLDLKAKYTKGMIEFTLPADVSDEQQTKIEKTSREVFEILGCEGFARIDFIVPEEGEAVVLEVNTLPGMTETSDFPAQAECYGMSYDELVENMLLSAIR